MAQLRILFSSFFLLFTFIPNQSFAVLYVVAVNAGVSAQIDVVDGKLAGRLGPIYKCVFDRTGEDYRYIVMPLKRSLYELDKGSVDVTLPLVYEAGRDRYGDFGGDLFFTDYVYLSTRELPPITRHSALTFVMLRNFAGLRVFLRDEEAEVIVVNSWEQAIGMLRKGRADAVPIPQVLVPTLMKDYEYTYYQQYAGRLGVSFYIAKRHENTGLTEKLRDAIGECSQA